MYHPRSPLPPTVLTKIATLPIGERRFYCQELASKYELSKLNLFRVAEGIATEWARRQDQHLQKCVDELYRLRDE